ncbi:hypothetical protein [Desulfobacula sp.]|uniref:hypothetical protein n=1 Tax=Desulfobacula sp. TaxID=2593537 RepID=UPI002608F867|nr:hypothetical protein [Desulfobacula sp.]
MEKENKASWKMIDDGLKSLMAGNDELSPTALKIKTKRLEHLARFAKTLVSRINERIREMPVGPIEPLFEEFFRARNEVDKNAN